MSRANLWMFLGLSAGISAALMTGCKSGPQDNELSHRRDREIRVWPPSSESQGSESRGASAQIGDEVAVSPGSDSGSGANREQLPPSERPAPGPRLVGFSAPPTASPSANGAGSSEAGSPGARRTAPAPGSNASPSPGDGAAAGSEPTDASQAGVPQNLTPELRSLYEKQLAAMRSYPQQQKLPPSQTAATPVSTPNPDASGPGTNALAGAPSAPARPPQLERLPPVRGGDAVASDEATQSDAAQAAKALAATDAAPAGEAADPKAADPKAAAGDQPESAVQQAAAESSGGEDTATKTAEFNEPSGNEPDSESNEDEKPVGTEKTAQAVAELDWQQLLDKTLAAMDAEIAKADGQPKAESLKIRRRLLAVAAEQYEEAVTPIETLPREEREFWKDELHGLSILLGAQGIPVPSRRNKEALRSLRSAERNLAAASTLEVRDLAFCSQVESFGRFDQFKENVFQPSQEVLLYAAVDNFATAQEGADFVTELQGSYQIVDGSGRRYADYDFLVDRQLCRDRRRDYFVPYRLYMPKDIVPGEYQLILTVEDKVGGKFGQNSISFRVSE